jgi:hypothetical protein
MPPSETSLKELLERVRKAEGPDRKIDLAVCEGLKRPLLWGGDIEGLGSQPYTASLDACLALMAEVLPGWHWYASCGPNGGHVEIDQNGDEGVTGRDYVSPGNRRPLPLALLDCILQALLSQDQSDAST